MDKSIKRKILLINFKRSGDLFQLAPIVLQLRKLNTDASIELLIFDEFLPAASILPEVDVIHTIERATLLSLRENALFNWAWGLNTFLENIHSVLQTSWDEVYNFCASPLSLYISKVLTVKKYLGPCLSPSSKVEFTDKNSLYFLENRLSLPASSLHLLDYFQGQIAQNYSLKNGPLPLEKITPKYQEENEVQCQQYFRNLRKKLHLNDIPVYLIGIQLSASTIEKEMDLAFIDELLGLLLLDKRLFPILLLAPNSKDKEKANYLNGIYENKLLSIDCDFSALSSVLSRIDYLITPDTSVKHLANWIQCKILEINSSLELLHLQGPYRVGDISFYPKSPETLIKKEEVKGLHPYAKDVYKTLLYGLKLLGTAPTPSHEEYEIVETVGNSPFIFHWPWGLSGNENFVLGVYLEKFFYYQYIHGKLTKAPYANILQQVEKTPYFDFIQKEKNHLVQVVKNLLDLLKEIRKFKTQRSLDPSFFIQRLQTLLDAKSTQTSLRFPQAILQYKMDQLPNQIFPNKIDQLEAILFDFKNNLNILTHSLELMSLVHVYEGIRAHAKI